MERKTLTEPPARGRAETCPSGLWSIAPLFLLMMIFTRWAEAGAAEGPRVVFVIGEDEYQTWETLPEFARIEMDPRGYRSTIIQGSKNDPNNFPGLPEALAGADLMVLSTRRRTPPVAQLEAVRAFLNAGKPLVGIRTACHAFARRNDKEKLAAGLAEWAAFDPEVLGGHYTGHYDAGPKTRITVLPAGADHPILSTVDISKLEGNGSLYQVNPLAKTTIPLLLGTIPGKPPEPVAWINLYGTNQARIFFTSLGHPDDFRNPSFRRLLLNGITWAVNRPMLLAAPPPR